MSDKQSTAIVRNFLDVPRCVLWSNPIDGQKRAKLILSFRDGNPRFTVYTNQVQGKEGVISWPADLPTFINVLTEFRDIAKGPNDVKFSNDSLATVYENDKPTDKKRVMATLYCGKSKEGIVYMSIISEGRPKIIFEFKISDFHVFKDGNGNPMGNDVMSPKLAIATIDAILAIVPDIMAQHAIESANTPYDPKAGNAPTFNQSVKTENFEDDIGF